MIGRVRESRNPKKVIRVSLRESYGEIRRVPVNLYIFPLYFDLMRWYILYIKTKTGVSVCISTDPRSSAVRKIL